MSVAADDSAWRALLTPGFLYGAVRKVLQSCRESVAAAAGENRRAGARGPVRHASSFLIEKSRKLPRDGGEA